MLVLDQKKHFRENATENKKSKENSRIPTGDGFGQNFSDALFLKYSFRSETSIKYWIFDTHIDKLEEKKHFYSYKRFCIFLT